MSPLGNESRPAEGRGAIGSPARGSRPSLPRGCDEVADPPDRDDQWATEPIHIIDAIGELLADLSPPAPPEST
jgi:hypothetical protein